MKKTYQEILEILKNNLQQVDDLAFGDFDSVELGLGNAKEETEARTGGEGKGENWQRVWYFEDHNVWIKIQGWYSSYHGTDFTGWDSCSEVAPSQKTITIYS